MCCPHVIPLFPSPCVWQGSLWFLKYALWEPQSGSCRSDDLHNGQALEIACSSPFRRHSAPGEGRSSRWNDLLLFLLFRRSFKTTNASILRGMSEVGCGLNHAPVEGADTPCDASGGPRGYSPVSCRLTYWFREGVGSRGHEASG